MVANCCLIAYKHGSCLADIFGVLNRRAAPTPER